TGEGRFPPSSTMKVKVYFFKSGHSLISTSSGKCFHESARAGRREDVKRILTELLELHSDSQRAAPAIAGVYTTLGEYDKAFEWLEKAYEEHCPYLAPIQHDFIFDPLCSDPRFKDFAENWHKLMTFLS
ncbi:MAG: tetratricopeptide repeat protein, partial [Nitrososphaerales archaeon]